MNIDKKTSYLFYLGLLILFIVIQSKGLTSPDYGDENAYIYMGKLISSGNAPYTDFFNAHPPLQIYFSGLIYALFGFNIIIFKLIPLISIIITSYLIFRIMLDRFGPLESLISILLFFSSYRLMLESTYFLGICLTTLFVTAGFYHYLKKKQMLSGIFFGIAGITGLYSFFPFLGLLIYSFFKKKETLKKTLIGFFSIILPVNILFLITSYPDYFVSVYLYHFLKPKIASNTFDMFFSFFKENFLLVLSFLSVFFVSDKKKIYLPLSAALTYIIFLAFIRIFNFYFILLIPFLAIVGGFSLSFIIKDMIKKPIFKKSFLIILILLAGFSFILSGKHLITTDFVSPSSLDSISNHIKENSYPGDKIFGDVLISPLIALKTGNDLAFYMADTNAMLFLSGLVTFEEITQKISEKKTRFVIVRPATGVGNSQVIGNFLVNSCVQEKYYKDNYWGDIFIYDCSNV